MCLLRLPISLGNVYLGGMGRKPSEGPTRGLPRPLGILVSPTGFVYHGGAFRDPPSGRQAASLAHSMTPRFSRTASPLGVAHARGQAAALPRHDPGSGVTPLTDALSSALSPLSEYPALAGVLGLALGIGLLLLTKRASRLMTPEDPAIGMAKVLALVAFGLVIAVAALTLLFFNAPGAIAPFGVAMAAGFLAVASYELFKFGGPAAASGRRR